MADAVKGFVTQFPRRSAVLYALLLAPGVASAQGDARTVAATAYDQGQRAFAAQDFNAAAEFFETANRALASAQASIQAIRAHRGAATPAHDARAATIALGLLTRYPADTRVVSYAYRVVDELSPRLGRLQVRCQGCDLAVDQQAAEPSVFVEPGGHTLTASWGGRAVSRQVSIAAGQTLPVEFAPPLSPFTPPVETPAVPAVVAPPAPVETPVAPAIAASPTVDAPPPRGLAPGLFVASLVVTAGLGGALLWSGLDTLSGRDAYALAPTQAGLDDGRGRELRTNVLIGATAAMGLTTLFVGGFTRWRSTRPVPMVALLGEGATLGLGGRF